jgi:septum formation protein
MARIVLASSSSRRRELLTRAGIRFTVVEPPPDEPIPPGICADLAAQLIARQKAVAVAATQPAGSFVIGADTIVVGPSGPLGKPGTPERAQAMLNELRGRRHTVLTGICVIVSQSDREALGLGRSTVRMHDYTDEAVHNYVNSGEPLDRSGAYAIQGGGGDLVDTVSGRIDTVVGLDVPLALRLLAEAGYPDPLPAATDVSLAPVRGARRPLAPLRATQRA